MVSTGESDLLAALHQGVLEQPLWHRFLEMLRPICHASHASLLVRPPDGPAVQLFAGGGLPQRVLDFVAEEFGENSLPRHRMREGRIYGLDELIDPGNPPERTFLDTTVHLRTVRVTDAGGTNAWLSILNDRELPAAATSLLSRLVPHLRIALNSLVTLERERVRSSISSEMMGRLNFGWLTIDARCHILDQSPNADEIFRRTGLLRRGRYDRLTFSSTAIDRDVAMLAKTFAAGEADRPRAFRVSLDPWIHIFVAPVHDQRVSLRSSAAAIVYLSGDRWSRDDRCAQLVDLFGLLPSEARLAWVIAQGRSIAEAAVELGITVETARNYSKKIYSKTGASGQAELVRIIFTSILATI